MKLVAKWFILFILFCIKGCTPSYINTYSPLVQAFIAIIGITITTLIAIYSIRRSAMESKLANIHHELSVTLTELVSILDRILNLLYNVSHNVRHTSVTDDKFIESAYDRYWREIDELNHRFIKVHGKMLLLLPKDIFDDFQPILKTINETRYIVKYLKPSKESPAPDTKTLQTIITKLRTDYLNLIDKCRNYLGIEKMKPIVTDSGRLLELGPTDNVEPE